MSGDGRATDNFSPPGRQILSLSSGTDGTVKTIKEYDQIPYEDRPIPPTHPDNLAVLGRLFGLETALPDRCRVLELGSANGGNLIPMAYHWPDSHFVGIELSQIQARAGRDQIKRLGLKNIELQHGDIIRLDKRLGVFDYIIVHGVYSWVPPKVQQHILETCRKRLKPQGIAYISYNTMPGWGLRGTLRAMLLRHCRDVKSPTERIAKAREFLLCLQDGGADRDTKSGHWLGKEVDTLLQAKPSYLFHEYLERINQPLYFEEFVHQTKAHGLQYLADANLFTMFHTTLPPTAAALIEQIQDLVVREQYGDFFRLRAFRQSLLCRAELQPSLELSPERLQPFRLYADLSSPDDLVLGEIKAQVFRSAAQEGYSLEHPLTKAALILLKKTYPNAMSLGELESESIDFLRRKRLLGHLEESTAFLGEIFNLILSQGIRLTASPRLFQTKLATQPRITSLVADQLAEGRTALASVRHVAVEIDTVGRRLLELADGSRTLDALVFELGRALKHEPDLTAYLETKGMPGMALKEVRENTNRLLQVFAHHGLFESEEKTA